MEEILSNDGVAAWAAVIVSLIGTFGAYYTNANKRSEVLKTIEIYRNWKGEGSEESIRLLKEDIDSNIVSLYRRFPIEPMGIPFLCFWVATAIAGIINLAIHYTDFFGGELSNALGVLFAGVMTYATTRLFWRE